MNAQNPIEENAVLPKPISSRRVLAGAFAALAVFGSVATASAEPLPPPPPPPNCTAADLAGVIAGVTAATSAYLFTHPPVNDFFTGLKGKTQEERRAELGTYLDANPQVRDELRGIRQPTRDFRARCGG
ncbi:heme-binding protein [Mycolicibacterium frederiksbergense]|uniref:heme-binding protein n=1 Tax=Mycolicibacterium frederiksbergense TaxID=117567 RepID=UPI00399B643E